MSNTACVVQEAATTYPSRAHGFAVGFSGIRCSVFLFWFVCLRPVSCVPNIARLSGMSILDFPPFSLMFIYFKYMMKIVLDITVIQWKIKQKYHFVGHIHNPLVKSSKSHNRYPRKHIHECFLAWDDYFDKKWRRQTVFMGPNFSL
jgi:hypothetical protein